MINKIKPLSPIIAHRGAPLVAPENTMASLIAAKNLGASWVEFDVRLTKDQQLVIFHDDTLERTTNGSGLVAATELQTLRQLDAGSWFAEKFKGEKIPTFKEYLDYASQFNLGVHIELKATPESAPLLATLVLDRLADYRSHQLSAIISSSERRCLETVAELDSNKLLGLISDEWTENWYEQLEELHCFSWHINHKQLNEERVRLIKEKNYRIFAYTVNDSDMAKQLLKIGVDALFSDDPQLLG